MSVPRFNMFSMIHKALRSMLYDAANALQAADFTNVEATEQAFEKVNLILELFDDHADHEDNHVLETARIHNPTLIAMFEKEHVTDRRLCAALRSAMSEYRAANTVPDRIVSGSKVFYAFNLFIAFNLEHMNKEENELSQTLWANYTNEDLMAINGKIIASVPPEKVIINITWMMRSCNDMELINFIKNANATAPPQVAGMVMKIAGDEIPAHRREHILAVCK